MNLEETLAHVGAALSLLLWAWLVTVAVGPFDGWEWLFGVPLVVVPAVVGLYLGLRPFAHLDAPDEPTSEVSPADRRPDA